MNETYRDYIVVKGARENNLKNVDVTIPKNKLVVFSGVSGSGKSTLAFDTIFAEGQRRYAKTICGILIFLCPYVLRRFF